MPVGTERRWPRSVLHYSIGTRPPRGTRIDLLTHQLGQGPSVVELMQTRWGTRPADSYMDAGRCKRTEAGAYPSPPPPPPPPPAMGMTADAPAWSGAPLQAIPYLQSGQIPPMPCSHQLSFDNEQEALAYKSWWWAHYTADAPCPDSYEAPQASPPPPPPPPPPVTMGQTTTPAGYTPPPPAPPPPPPPAPPVAVRPPTAAEKAAPLVIDTFGEEVTRAGEPAQATLATVMEQPQASQETKRTPWGWIVGGSAAVLLVAGTTVYLVKKKR